MKQLDWPAGITVADRKQLQTMPSISTAWPGGPAGGRIINTTHYRIYTTIDDRVEQRLMARVLEADYSHFMQLIPNARPQLPMAGFVFRNRAQWEHFTRRTAGKQASIYLHIESGGYERNGIFVTYQSNISEVLSVIAHEAWHQFSYLALKDHLPAWLDEGLATQCEAIHWHDNRPEFTPWLNTFRWDMLRMAVVHRQLLPLADMVRTQAGDVVMHDKSYVDTYYSEVWSFMLFLEHSRYRPALLHLLAMAEDGKLNALLAGSKLTPSDIRYLTIRWNRTAGKIYFNHFFNHYPGLKRRYVTFVNHLVDSWPPRPAATSLSKEHFTGKK